MAYRRRRLRRKRYNELEKLAYNLGRVEKGLKNTNSKVHDSYVKGCKSTARKCKTLI